MRNEKKTFVKYVKKEIKPKSGYRITVDDFLKANRVLPHPAPQVRQGLRQEDTSEGGG
ncbi:MAG: hypothetical protein ACI4TU_05400 [Candidatus Cryptobacteroides sp.]